MAKKTCSIVGCERFVYAKLFCHGHYNRAFGICPPNQKIKERHGKHGTKEYRTWNHIKNRCLDKNCKSFKWYGKRGITIYKPWADSFSAFLDGVGKAPFKNAEIDRIDNDGNYEPGNIRWVSRVENMRNNSQTKLTIEKAREIRRAYRNSQSTGVELAAHYGVVHSTIYSILHNKTWRE